MDNLPIYMHIFNASMISTNMTGAIMIPQDDIDNATKLFLSMKDLRMRLSNCDEESITKAFNSHTSTVIKKLTSRSEMLLDNSLKDAELIMAKYGLYDGVFQQIILVCTNISPVLAQTISELRKMQLSLLSDIQQKMNLLIKQHNQDKSDMHALISNINKVTATTVTTSATAVSVNADGRGSGDNVNSPMMVTPKKSTQAIHKARTSINLLSTPRSPHNPSSLAATATNTPSSSCSKVTATTSPKKNNSKSIGNSGNSNSVGTNWLISFRLEVQRCLDIGGVRSMTIHECVDVIEKIIEGKEAYNSKCTSSSPSSSSSSKGVSYQPETMEHYMYSMFEKKYGLRSIAIEHVAKIMNCLKYHSSCINSSSSDQYKLKLFQMMLRNQLDEGFWLTQRDLTR